MTALVNRPTDAYAAAKVSRYDATRSRVSRAGLFGQTHGPHRVAAVRRGERRQQPGQIVLRWNIVRLDPQRLLIVLDGFPDTVRLLEGECEIAVRLDVTGFDPQHLLILPNGIADLPLLEEEISEIVVRLGVIWFNRE